MGVYLSEKTAGCKAPLLASMHLGSSKSPLEVAPSWHCRYSGALHLTWSRYTGEVYDLLEAPKLRGARNGIDLTRTPTQIFHDIALSGRCSALITVTRELTELLFLQETENTHKAVSPTCTPYTRFCLMALALGPQLPPLDMKSVTVIFPASGSSEVL